MKFWRQCPNVFTADSLAMRHSWGVTNIDGKWFIARPLSVGGLWTRLKIAAKVFLGFYDAVKFNGQ